MQNRPSESLKVLADELAGLIFTDSKDKQRMDELLQRLCCGVPDGNDGPDRHEAPTPPAEQQHKLWVDPQAPVAAGAPGEKIGIWKRTVHDGEVVYEKNAEVKYEWTIWADLPQIEVKKTKKRIILIGESVSRGFFYDPYYTVAIELEAILRKTVPLADSEVIDLGRCGLNMEQLLELAASCTVLDPDAIVFLAGNNWWINNFMDNDDYRHMRELLRADRIRDIKAFIEEKFSRKVIAMLDELKKMLVEKNIPVVFAIPAFNLRDWKSDDILAGNHLVEWEEARARADAALALGRMDELRTAAERMADADPSNPIGYELLAEYHLLQEEKMEAIRNLELARDTALYCRANNTPRCFAVIERTISAFGGEFGIEVVNLQEIFRHLPDGVADRTLFLDYCHLSAKGIKIAMRHVAQRLVNALAGTNLAPEDIAESGYEVSHDIQSIAHFCAATHNGHYGQRAELIGYHSREAIRHSDTVKSVMQKAIDFSTRRATTSLCSTFEEIVLETNVQQYERGATFFHPKNGKMMDINLVNANVRSLQSIGVDLAAKVDELRKKEHGVDLEPVNLLQSFYCRKTYASPIVTINTNFFQVRSVVTNFYLIVQDDRPLHFDISYRAPGVPEGIGNIKIAVHNKQHCVAELPLGKEWARQTFMLKDVFREGVNEVFMIWPCYDPPAPVTRHSAGSIAYLEAMFPVLGEIHSFTVNLSGDGAPGQTAEKQRVKADLSVVV